MHHILFDCERMKYKFVGLYDYCLHLATSLAKRMDANRESIAYYMPRGQGKILGKEARYVWQHSLQKLFQSKASRFDVWHCTYQGSQYYPSAKSTPIVLTVHDLNFMYGTPKSLEKKRRYLNSLKKKIARAAHIITISNYVKQDLLRYELLPPDKPCSVIYNGCNQAQTPQTPLLDISLVSFPQAFLFSMGAVASKKNFHVLPRLLTGNDLHLVIAGVYEDPTYLKQIMREAKQCNVANRVHLIGPVSEQHKRWYLSHCKAFVFPSISEGFGLPVVEAMAFGKTIITSDCTSLPEIGGEEVHYWKNFDADHMLAVLADALESACHPEKSERIKKRASLFNWDKAADQYLAIYRQLY